MEAFWNYIYFQTLGINAFDELGHLLRIVQIQGDPCAGYVTNPDKDDIARCNSWLGPSQPGVDGQPDPTEGGAARAAHGRPAPAAPPGRTPPGAGGPSAPPVPGKRDLSKPQQTLPARGTAAARRRDGRSEAAHAARHGGRSDGGNPTDLLDYLLSP